MKMRSILYIALTATPFIAGCGSSDSDSDDGSKAPAAGSLEALYGNWTSDCRYNSDNDNYGRQTVTFSNNGTVSIVDKAYSDFDCELLTTSSDPKTYNYTDDGQMTGADTGLVMRQVTLQELQDAPYKWLIYVTPQLNKAIVTYGSTTYPTQMTLDHVFNKEGASQAYVAGSANVTILHHFALNFKTGGTEADGFDTVDASTAAWSPSSKYVSGESSDGGIWVRTLSDGDYNYLHDAGAVALDQVTTIPTTWLRKYGNDENPTDPIPSVKKNHSYVIKLRDNSYAKFRVLNTPDPQADNWPLLIEYQLM